MRRSLPVTILLAVLTVVSPLAVIPVPVSADHGITDAPPLTDEQLEALRAVDTWEIEYTLTVTKSGSGGGSDWSASIEEHLEFTARMIVTGQPGCENGCSLDPEQSEVIVSYSDVRTSSSTWEDSLTGEECSASHHRTRHHSGGPDVSDGRWRFWLDYFTNPPRASSGGSFTGSVEWTHKESNSCDESQNRDLSGTDSQSYGGQFSHLDHDDGFEVGEILGAGDTQVLVENGRFVIRGFAEENYDDAVFSFNSPDFTGTIEQRAEWVARPVTEDEADLEVEISASEERLSGAPGEELPLEFTVVVTNNGPQPAPAEIEVDIVEAPDPPPPPGEVQPFVPPLAITSSTCNPTSGLCEGSGGSWHASVPELEAGESRTITIAAVVRPGAGGSVAATADAAIPDAIPVDPNVGNNGGEVEVTVEPDEADLRIEFFDATPRAVFAPPDVPVPVGFTITVMNAGPSPTPATVSLALDPTPVPLQFTSCSAASAFTCLPFGSGAHAVYGGPSGGLEAFDAETALITYHVTVPSGMDSGAIVARAAVTAEGVPSLDPDGLLAIDPNPGNNVAPATVRVVAVPLDTAPDGPVDVEGHDGGVAPDDEVEVSGDGFEPDSTVNIVFQSDPVFLAQAETDGDGAFSVPVQIPGDAEDGEHEIVAMGPAPDGGPRVLAASVIVDTIPPTTSAARSAEPNEHGWHNTDVTVTLTATDNEGGSGVATITYSATGAEQLAEQTVTGDSTELTVSAEGETTITYWAEDNAGNREEPQTLTVRLDETAPTTSASVSPEPNEHGWHNTDGTVSLTATDNEGGSGVERVVYSADVANAIVEQRVLSDAAELTIDAEGETTITYWAVDRAGNAGTPQTLTVRIDKTAPDASVSLSPETLWPPNHKLVDVTATVDASDALSGVDTTLLTSLISSEPDSGLDDEDVPNDIQDAAIGSEDFTFQLRAERNGAGDGRVYTAVYRVTDLAGNSVEHEATVLVPHDRRDRDGPPGNRVGNSPKPGVGVL